MLLDAWRLALGTLTAIPVAPPALVDRRRAGMAMVLAPLAVLPLAVAVTLVALAGHGLDLPIPVAALLALGATILGNRAFHLDGLSDTVDGMAASYDRERSLAVMKSGTSGPAGVVAVVLVLGLLKWDRFAVVMRSATQQVRSLDYVAAAQSAGASTKRILLGEILPNVMPHLIVVATLEAASAILLEAALSFLGLGVQPPLPSWGLMISEAKAYMFFSFWLIAIPGTALAVLIFAINLCGDGLHDLLSPEGRS